MKQCGIYTIGHPETTAVYIGGANDIINRWQHHKTKLRQGEHTSPKLQELWDEFPEQLELKIVCLCDETDLKTKEIDYYHAHHYTLNATPPIYGARHSNETKHKMRQSRADYLEGSPAAHAHLSEKAKKQHESGTFGKATWKTPQNEVTIKIKQSLRSQSKITPDIVREIRAAQEPSRKQAAKFGIGQSTVMAIRNRKLWADIQ